MYYWEIPSHAGSAQLDDLAVVGHNGTRTWSQLLENIDRVAGIVASDHAVAPGSRVGVLLHNGAWQAELYFGIAKAGCVVVPLNWRLAPEGLEAVLVDAGVDLVFAEEELSGAVPAVPGRLVVLGDGTGDAPAWNDVLATATPLRSMPAGCTEDDVVMLPYTSGTTGRPKGVMHTHRTLVASALRLCSEMRLRRGEAFFTCLPMFFAGAHSSMTTPIMRGCTVVCSDFSPAALVDAVERHGVTATIMVPTMITRVMREVSDDAILGRIRNWCYAGDAMPVNALRRGIERLGPVFSGYYAQVESGLAGTTHFSEDHVVLDGDDRRLRSAGRPSVATGVRVVDLDTGEDVPADGTSRGEIWLRAPSVMKGYWNQPDLTRERLRADGWLQTTDIGVRDGDGFLYIVDRSTDMIITGGVNVYPREIERVVARHADVRDVAVVGMPSDEWGQEVTACVTLERDRGLEELSREIADLCGAELAGYQKPRRVVVRDDLPMTGSGKVMKSRLREMLAAEAAASGEPVA